jgi:hypothetical protein
MPDRTECRGVLSDAPSLLRCQGDSFVELPNAIPRPIDLSPIAKRKAAKHTVGLQHAKRDHRSYAVVANFRAHGFDRTGWHAPDSSWFSNPDAQGSGRPSGPSAPRRPAEPRRRMPVGPLRQDRAQARELIVDCCCDINASGANSLRRSPAPCAQGISSAPGAELRERSGGCSCPRRCSGPPLS